MIKHISLKNFRGFSTADINLAPITVLTGANNSGKSSIGYALVVLKNIVSNPNQPLDSLLNLGFLNMGGFKEAIHLKDEDKNVEFRIVCAGDGETEVEYGIDLGIGRRQSRFSFGFPKFATKMSLDVSFPYPLNGSATTTVQPPLFDVPITINWNGVTGTVSAGGTVTSEGDLASIQKGLVQGPEELRRVDFIPLKRGFTKPVFGAVPLQAQMITEDEIATLLANDRDLEGKVDLHLETICNRTFTVRPTLGTSSFQLQTRDRKTGFVCDLVNEGFGTNQLVYLLAKALRPSIQTVFIEEPEIHLHPDAIKRLVGVLIDIAGQEGRRFVVSTHSEHFVLSLLSQIAQGKLSADKAAFYFVKRERNQSVLERQEANNKGQIEGGLKSFFETELDHIREFLGSAG